MELAANAVVMNDGSYNQIPGRSLRQASDETPPSTIGISADSPVRLSVIVIDAGTVSLAEQKNLDRSASLKTMLLLHRTTFGRPIQLASQIVPIHVGLPQFEAEPLVEPVGSLARWPRRQINRAGSGLPSRGKGGCGQSLTDAPTPCSLIDHDILDQGADRGRDSKGDEGQRAKNVTCFAARNQKFGRRAVDHVGQLDGARGGRRTGQLRDETRNGADQL